MTQKTDAFAEFRRVLSKEPDEGIFRALCWRLQRQHRENPQEAEELWLPYAVEHLQDWPAHTRVGTSYMLKSFLEQSPTLLPLMKEAQADSIELLDAIKESPHPLRVTSFSLHNSPMHRSEERLSEAQLEALLNRDDLQTLRELSLHNHFLSVYGSQLITNTPHLVQLEHLELVNSYIQYKDIIEWLQQEGPGLRSLNLSGNKINAEELTALLGSTRLQSVEKLDLSHCYTVYPSTTFPCAGFAPLAKLLELDLSYNQLRDEDVLPWIRQATHSQLRKLNLGQNRLGDDAIVAMASQPAFAKLQELKLFRNNIRTRGLAALASSPHICHLESLLLASNSIKDEGAQALATDHLASLQTLGLQGNGLTDAGVVPLIQHPKGDQLVDLRLDGNPLSVGTAEAIAKAKHLGHLKYLSLAGCTLGDEGLRALTQATHLAKLTTLYIDGNDITEQGVQALLQATTEQHFPQLEYVGLRHNRIAPAFIEEDKPKGDKRNLYLDTQHNDDRSGPLVWQHDGIIPDVFWQLLAAIAEDRSAADELTPREKLYGYWLHIEATGSIQSLYYYPDEDEGEALSEHIYIHTSEDGMEDLAWSVIELGRERFYRCLGSPYALPNDEEETGYTYLNLFRELVEEAFPDLPYLPSPGEGIPGLDD